jgi:hypothetical protein
LNFVEVRVRALLIDLRPGRPRQTRQSDNKERPPAFR